MKTKTRGLIVGVVALAAAGATTPAAFAQVDPPAPPDEVCEAIDTAGSEIQGVEEEVSDATGEPLPASPGGNVRSIRFTLGCRFVDPSPDPGGDSGDSDESGGAGQESGDDATVLPAATDRAVAPAVAQEDPETLPVTGGGAGPAAGAILAAGALARWLNRRFGD